MEHKVSVLVLAFPFLLAACKKSDERKTPPPGLNQVPQIFVALEAKRADPWLRHDDTDWGGAAHVRVERATWGDPKTAAESLRVWNGRSGDLWVLGPGLPQKTWLELQLPRRSDLKVVFWDPEGTTPADVEVWALDRASLERLLRPLCQPACRFLQPDPKLGALHRDDPKLPPIEISTADTPSTAALRIGIDWAAFLRKRLIAPQSHERQNLGVFSGDLRVEVGSGPKDSKRWTEQVEKWSLDELRRGGL